MRDQSQHSAVQLGPQSIKADSAVPKPQPVSMAGLTTALSEERLTTFRKAGDDDCTVLARYVWNLALTMAFTPVLHATEVTLRNAIYNAGRALYPSINNHGGVPCWLDNEPSYLEPTDTLSVTVARESIRARGKLRTPGRLVAELGLGFWIRLLGRAYDQGAAKGTSKGFPLWTAQNLKHAFPNLPSRFRERERLRERFERIRVFRNRVSHHEPIFQLDIPTIHGEWSSHSIMDT